MKIFLSSLENGGQHEFNCILNYFKEKQQKMNYNLCSFFYVRNQKERAIKIRDNTKEILIDSGAHSFQKGITTTKWEEYTKEYIEFIKLYDKDNVLGYFEMDIDNIVGYEKVLKMRKQLEATNDKIIPVWHKNRGIEDYKRMCQKYTRRIIAITGFKNEDVRDEQYLMFLKYAKKYKCKVHCLGMTRKKILDKVPFYSVDSSSWKQSGIYGKIKNRGKVSKDFSKNKRYVIMLENYKEGVKEQMYYENKWKRYN